MPRISAEHLTVINSVISPSEQTQEPAFATGNLDKLQEIERILGREVVGEDLNIDEIQGSPEKVLGEKAKAAWRAKQGTPIIVEDTALVISGIEKAASYASDLTDDIGSRMLLCRALHGRSAKWQVGFAIYDGDGEPQTRIRDVTGKIADRPRGINGFGFDDIFIPDNQVDDDGKPLAEEFWKTNAEMTAEEKDRYSPRRLALEAMDREPFVVGQKIFQLPEPYKFQLQAIRTGRLAENAQAIAFAYDLEPLEGNTPNAEFTIDTVNPYHELPLDENGEFRRFVPTPDSANVGLIVTSMDIAQDLYGSPYRLRSSEFGDVRLWQMGPEAIKMALASRVYEFNLHHNEEVYTMLREMMTNPNAKTPERSNAISPVFEALLKIVRQSPDGAIGLLEDIDEREDEERDMKIAAEIVGSMATNELGYARMSSDKRMSRSKAANMGLFVTTGGVPSSIFRLGAMPPVTGSSDVLATAAASFWPCHAPRNSYLAGGIDRQLTLVTKAHENVESIGAPADITELMKMQIGVAIGCEDPDAIMKDVNTFHANGIRRFRIYTTNVDPRPIELAYQMRQRFGESIIIDIAPVGDYEQAIKFNDPDIKVNSLLAGHGGGENCTSLAGGGVANALEVMYCMATDPDFNDVAIGLEGGTGTYIGALLGIVDAISLNRRGVNGGIETGGLWVEHVNGRVAQPYHGSASPVTQHIEAIMDPAIAERRLNDAGMLHNVEGVPNYMFKPRSVVSIVNRFQEARMLAGRALADQQSQSIADLRRLIAEVGFINHRIVSPSAGFVAGTHRNTQ